MEVTPYFFEVVFHLSVILYRRLTLYVDILRTTQCDTEWRIHILCHVVHLKYMITYANVFLIHLFELSVF
ncbi:hypothetical protein J6TS2_49420 [Heyndrickxia sporothermodurans]|nr:hypothetical protein J6TS2_49420 [Heyndrickxia sporothermodurans]